MCGIVGICDLGGAPPAEEATLRAMLGMIRHRGPDQFGIYLDEHVGLGNARLSIIDLSTGQQPIANEDESLWIVFNGEVFNYPELRPELEARGHRVHHHQRHRGRPARLRGVRPGLPVPLQRPVRDRHLGQRGTRSLFLARDRLGVRPLFYTQAGGALRLRLGDQGHPRRPRRRRRARSRWRWTRSSPSGARSRRGRSSAGSGNCRPATSCWPRTARSPCERYWGMAFPEDGARRRSGPRAEYAEELRDLLVDATRIRLRADVPVGAYLSGGLDSSTIAAIVRTPDARTRSTRSRSPSATASSTRAGSSSRWPRPSAPSTTSCAPPTPTSARLPGGHLAHGDADHAHRPGADVPALQTRARQPLQGRADRRGRGRVPRRLRHLQGGQDPPLLGGAAGVHLAAGAVRPHLPVEAAVEHATPSRRSSAWGSRDVDARDYSHALRWRTTARAKRFFSEDVRRAAAADGGQLDARHTRTGSTAGATWSRPSTWRRPSSSRSTCCRRRATGWRWRTPSRDASPSSTTASSSSPTSCRRRSSCTG